MNEFFRLSDFSDYFSVPAKSGKSVGDCIHLRGIGDCNSRAQKETALANCDTAHHGMLPWLRSVPVAAWPTRAALAPPLGRRAHQFLSYFCKPDRGGASVFPSPRHPTRSASLAVGVVSPGIPKPRSLALSGSRRVLFPNFICVICRKT